MAAVQRLRGHDPTTIDVTDRGPGNTLVVVAGKLASHLCLLVAPVMAVQLAVTFPLRADTLRVVTGKLARASVLSSQFVTPSHRQAFGIHLPLLHLKKPGLEFLVRQ